MFFVYVGGFGLFLFWCMVSGLFGFGLGCLSVPVWHIGGLLCFGSGWFAVLFGLVGVVFGPTREDHVLTCLARLVFLAAFLAWFAG